MTAILTDLQHVLLHGEFVASPDVERSEDDPNVWTAGVTVTASLHGSSDADPKKRVWMDRVQCHGGSEKEARDLRDFVHAAVLEKAASITMVEFVDLGRSK